MKRSTLSVLMPNYNHGAFIAEALDAILAQSYRPSELIIIDDASTDHSMEVLEGYARKEPLIRLIRNERNMGVLYNVNRLLSCSSGKYLLFAAADDKVLPKLFERSLCLMAKNPSAGLCSTASLVFNESDGARYVLPTIFISETELFLTPERVKSLLFATGNWIEGNTTIYRRDVLLELGGFPTELKSLADSFIAQVIALKHGACFIPEPLAIWRRLDTGYSATMSSNLQRHKVVLDTAVALMRTKYADIFSSAHIDIWEREALFSVSRHALRSLRSEQNRLMNSMSSSGGKRRPISLPFSVILRLTIRLQEVLMLVLLITTYWPPQVARRALNKIKHLWSLQRTHRLSEDSLPSLISEYQAKLK